MFEALALGGAFDELEASKGLHRAQFFALDAKERTVLEMAIKYGQAIKKAEASSQTSSDDEASIFKTCYP